MSPVVFLALPLLLPMTNQDVRGRVDLSAPQAFLMQTPRAQLTADQRTRTEPHKSGPAIPPLFVGNDGAVSLSLSPGSPCTAACIKLAGTF
jgi:hypothetical protein